MCTMEKASVTVNKLIQDDRLGAFSSNQAACCRCHHFELDQDVDS